MPTSLTPHRLSPTGWRRITRDVDASATFKAGWPVVINATGYATDGAAVGSAVNVSSSPNGLLLGFAESDAATCIAEGIPVSILTPTSGAWIELNLYHSTAASATYSRTNFDLQNTLPLKHQATGIFVADVENDGTNDLLRVVDVAENNPWSEQYMRVRCGFMASVVWSAGD